MKKLVQLVILTCILSYYSNAQITTTYYVFGGGCDSATFFNVFVSGGTDPYIVTFDFGDGFTETVTAQQGSAWADHQYATAGTYNTAVYIVDNVGATDTVYETHVELDAMEVEVVIVPDDCSPNCTGSLTATVTGGAPPYVYSWGNGATTPVNSGLCAGSYTLEIWDSSQCFFWGVYVVDSGFVYELVKDDPSCQGSDGSAAVEIGGDPSIITYIWSNGSTDSSISGLNSGVYSVTIADTSGCSIADSIELFDSCGTITGTIYADANGNGMIDGGEPTLGGVLVTLMPDNITTVTNNNGEYELSAPSFSTFTITATPPDVSIFCSGLVIAQGAVSFPATGNYSVTVTSGSPTSSGNDFAIEPPDAPCGEITGHVFDDLNGNGTEDPGEPGFAGAIIDLGNGQYASTDVNGDYAVEVFFDSTVTLNLQPFAPNYYCGTNSPSYSQTFPTGGAGYTVTLTTGMASSTGNDFGITASTAGFDVGVYSVWTTQNISAGSTLNVWMDYKSNGNITNTCVLRLEFDPLLTFTSASITPSSSGTDFVEWTFPPGSTTSWYCMYMTFDLDSNAVAGDSLVWNATYSCGAPDDCPDNDSIQRIFFVDFGPAKTGQDADENAMYAYDQLKELPLEITAEDRTFSYTVSFQNVTSETAYNLTVIDTLSEHLDINTLSFPFASMPYNLSIAPGNVLIFQFENIQLADTGSDLQNSYGFLQYNILMKENLPIGTEIRNKASIIFNGYEPIVTNEVVQKIADPSSVSSVDQTEVLDVYPNPNNGLFMIDMNQLELRDAGYRMVNMIGETIASGSLEGPGTAILDLKDISNGVYLLQIESEDQILTKRILISK